MDFMKEAVKLALKSGKDVPVGAVLVDKNGDVISKFHNEKEKRNDVTAHAEILAIRKAQKVLKSNNLEGCSLYVTLEPCPMCAFAIINSKISKVFFGAYDNCYGAFGSRLDMKKLLNSKIEVLGGIMEEENKNILKNYFKELR